MGTATITAIAACALGILLYAILKSPFSYPYFVYNFDVSGKRNPRIEDLLDNYLISGGFGVIQSHKSESSNGNKIIFGKLNVAF